MATMISTVIFATLVCVIMAETCEQVENLHTEDYTYHICSDLGIRQFSAATNFCTKKRGHLVTFPNKQEFEFIISHLNATQDDSFQFFVGLYQESKNDNYNPQTGRFYWVSNNNTQITVNSTTYWQPFSDQIRDFHLLDSLKKKQYTTFLMDKQGQVYPAARIGFTELSAEYKDPYIICMTEGVNSDIPSTKLSPTTQRQLELELWLIIVIAAGGVLFLIIVGVCVGCCVTRRRAMFEKVPQSEKREHSV